MFGNQSLSDFRNGKVGSLMFMEDPKTLKNIYLSTQLDHLKVISSERRKMEEVPGASLPRLSFIRLSSPWVLLDGKNIEHRTQCRTQNRGKEKAEQPRLSVIKTGGRPLQIVAPGRQFEVSFHL